MTGRVLLHYQSYKFCTRSRTFFCTRSRTFFVHAILMCPWHHPCTGVRKCCTTDGCSFGEGVRGSGAFVPMIIPSPIFFTYHLGIPRVWIFCCNGIDLPDYIAQWADRLDFGVPKCNVSPGCNFWGQEEIFGNKFRRDPESGVGGAQ